MKVALIGLGMVSKTYAEAFAASDKVSLAGVMASRPESTRAWAERHADAFPGLKCYESAGEIASDDEVDFALITTPPNAREALVHVLAPAGKPILMEKPVERDVPRATALVELCEAKRVPLGIVLQHRMRPAAAELARMAVDFGALRTAEVAVPWWRPQAYYDEPGRGTYERDGGGVLISQAIHTLDLMLSLTGPVAEVQALTATTGYHGMEAEDFVAGGMRFENGAVGALFTTTASYPGRPEYITLGYEKATAHLLGNSLKVNWLDGREQIYGASGGTGSGADPMAFTCDWHQWIIEDFADSLREGRAPRVTGRMALEVHRLIAAIETSGKSGGTVTTKR